MYIKRTFHKCGLSNIIFSQNLKKATYLKHLVHEKLSDITDVLYVVYIYMNMYTLLK